jgi:hypothetical protein
MSDEAQVQRGEPTGEGDALPAVGTFRLVLGLAQGIALYLLEHQREAHGWPASDPYLFVPLFAVACIVPIFVLQAAGRMRRTVLIAWAIAATTVVAALAWYDAYRQAPDLLPRSDGLPTFPFVFFVFTGLFIAQSLITAGDADSSFLTRYRNYFDATWKFGVQLALAAAFVGAFWSLLWLGAALFSLINLTFFRELIQHSWFYFPATSIAAAMAIHLTDVRAQMVIGIRTVGLTLLSWLLPLLTLLVAAFISSLGFTGLEPLWRTRAGVGILLVAAGVLVVLINAVYQDGDSADARPIVLRYGELVASVLLIPLVALSAYALALRVQQYGWTIERIGTLACILVASCYALGYTASALFSLMGGQWMWALESVNIFVAFLILVLLGLLFSPAGDPARLSVASQMARLESGTTKASAFDFTYLRNQGGRYGTQALQHLAALGAGKDAAAIRASAKNALAISPFRYATVGLAKPLSLADRITVYPLGRKLPESFLKQRWIGQLGSDPDLPSCLSYEYENCDAYFTDVDGDGQDELVVFNADKDANPPFDRDAAVLKLSADGHWNHVGIISGRVCGDALTAMRAGKLAVGAPVQPILEISVAGQHFAIAPRSPDVVCPAKPHIAM